MVSATGRLAGGLAGWLVASMAAGAPCDSGSGAQGVEKRICSTTRVTGAAPAIDARLDDPAWELVPWTETFTVRVPNEGAKPAEQTAFKVLYDDRNIYVGIRLDDSDPSRIERRLGRRDQYSGDDVVVWFDSLFDRRTAFGFAVNAAGVKWDAISADDGARVDTSWDPVWFVETAVGEGGWTAEMRIPLAQLRFGDREEQVWGMQVSRGLFRRGEFSVWQFIPGRSGGEVSQYGELRGLSGLQSRTQVELLPYAVGQIDRAPVEAGNPFATGQAGRAIGGLDAKVGLSGSLTLDATVNPDFGQVEADPSVVNLTAFETYYQEKRPFFVEGSRFFDVPITSFGTSSIDRIFYSRRIGRPPHHAPQVGAGEFADVPDRTSILGAAKVTGRSGSGLSVGLLSSVTGRESATVDDEGARRSEAVEPLTHYFVGRVQQDYRRGQTTVGGLLTAVNRRLDEPQFASLHTAAYTGGIDLAHYWSNRAYYARGTVVFSHVRGSAEAIARTQRASPRFFQRPDAAYLGYDPARTALSGNGGSVEVGRSGNSRFLVNASYAWRSPGLELNDLGFQRTADYRVTRVQAQYNEFQPFWLFRTFNMSGALWVNHLYSGERAGVGGYANVTAQWRNFWRLTAMWETNSEYLDTTVLRGGPAMMTSARSQVFANLQSDSRKRFVGALTVARLFDPNGEVDQRTVNVGLTWRPTGALDLSLNPSVVSNDPRLQYVAAASAAGSPRYVLASLAQRTVSLTARVNYAVTPTLTVQYYGQPFVSAGRYHDFKRIADPRAAAFADRFSPFSAAELTRAAGRLSIDENGDGATDYAIGDPDYGFRQFRSNLVVRWEYSPGSTLFVVWSQGRTGANREGAFSFGDGLRDLFEVQPANAFLVKLTRWIAW